MSRSKEEKLEAYLQLISREVPDLVRKVEVPGGRIRVGSVLTQLSHFWHAKAIHAYYVNGNKHEFKQCCYLSAKIDLQSVGKEGGEEFETSRIVLSALMSDSPELIDEVANVDCQALSQRRHEYGSAQSLTYMYQLAMRRDDEQLREMLASARKAPGRVSKRNESIYKFLDLLLQGDVRQLEEHVKDKHASMKSAEPIMEDFMGFLAPLELKLCWHRGIPAKVEHELIPMGLMPVEPLQNYDNCYDFLKPGWVPARRGIVDKVLSGLRSIIG